MSPLQSVRILELFCERICYLHYSLRTEEAHVYWPISFIRCHSLRHPGEMGKAEIEAFLRALVSKRNVSSSTHQRIDASTGIVVAAVLARQSAGR